MRRTEASEKLTAILSVAGTPGHVHPGPVWAPGLGGARAEIRGVLIEERFSRRPGGMFSGHTDSSSTPRRPGEMTNHRVTTHRVRRGRCACGNPRKPARVTRCRGGRTSGRAKATLPQGCGDQHGETLAEEQADWSAEQAREPRKGPL